MTDYKVVFCDIDGTLLDSQHRLPDSARQAVKALTRRDIPFVIATGRTSRGIVPLLKELDIQTPFIASNGGYVCSADCRCLASTGFSVQTAVALRDEIAALLPDAQCVAYFENDWIVANPDTVAARLECSVTRTVPLVGTMETVVPADKPVQKLLYLDPKDKLPELSETLKKRHPDLGIFVSNENMMEILPAGVSKAWGARELCRLYKTDASQTVAFGDGLNDIGLFSFCGLAVAMGNAPDAVKKKASRIAATNDDDGLAKALNDIFDLNL